MRWLVFSVEFADAPGDVKPDRSALEAIADATGPTVREVLGQPTF